MDHFVDTQNSSLPFHYDVLEWWLISNSLNYWLFCIILSKKLCTECEFCNIFQSEEATLNSIISAKYASILISKVSSELLTSWSFQNCPWWSELTRKCVHKMGLKVNARLFMTFTVVYYTKYLCSINTTIYFVIYKDFQIKIKHFIYTHQKIFGNILFYFNQE